MEPTNDAPVLVSACLVGLRCRYDGQSKPCDALAEAVRGRTVLPVCPETAAGLGVPRPPIEIVEGDGAHVLETGRDVRSATGEDVGARLAAAVTTLAETARRAGAREAILKARSPSCAVRRIYRGGVLVSGEGVLTAALRRMGLRVRSEEDL